MKRIKKYLASQIHEFMIMPRVLQIVFIVLFLGLMYAVVDLYLLRQEAKKIEAEKQQLERWPFN